MAIAKVYTFQNIVNQIQNSSISSGKQTSEEEDKIERNRTIAEVEYQANTYTSILN